MKQKIVIALSALMPIFGWTQTLERSKQSVNSDLISIDNQLDNLKKQLHEASLRDRQEEVEGQGLMIADWEAYGQEVQKIKREEDLIHQLQKQIDELEYRKTEILKQSPTRLLT